jgi:hypothetical protein
MEMTMDDKQPYASTIAARGIIRSSAIGAPPEFPERAGKVRRYTWGKFKRRFWGESLRRQHTPLLREPELISKRTGIAVGDLSRQPPKIMGYSVFPGRLGKKEIAE